MLRNLGYRLLELSYICIFPYVRKKIIENIKL